MVAERKGPGGPRPQSRPDDKRAVDRLLDKEQHPEKYCSKKKRNGVECTRYPIKGGTVCTKHGGNLPVVKEAALRRLEKASYMAAGVMVEIAGNPRVFAKDRIAAAAQILDRAKIGNDKDVNVNVTGFEALMKSGKLLVDIDDE